MKILAIETSCDETAVAVLEKALKMRKARIEERKKNNWDERTEKFIQSLELWQQYSEHQRDARK